MNWQPKAIIIKAICLPSLITLLLIMSFNPKASYGFELFGLKLWSEKPAEDNSNVERAKAYQIRIFSVDNKANIFDKSNLSEKNERSGIDIVKSSSDLFLDRDSPTPSSVRLLTKAREDYKRILNGFYAEGYFGALISIRINGLEAATIPPETLLPDNSYIIITVNPGPLYLFSRAIIHNYPVNYSKAFDSRRQKETIAFAKNNAAKAKYIFQAENQAIRKWQELGYARAKVTKQAIIADHKTRTISADIWIDPGIKVYYKKFILENVSEKPTLKPDFILWASGLKIGDIYDPTQLEEARNRLAKLGVFQAQLISEENITKDGGLDVKFSVQERPLRRIGLGANYSSLDGFGLTSYALHRNLFGEAENLKLSVNINNISNFHKQDWRQKNFLLTLNATYIKPAIFFADNNFLLSLKHQREQINAYRTDSISLQSGFNYSLTPVLSGHSYIETSHILSRDPSDKFSRFFTFGLSNALLYDNRDSITNPSIGHYNEAMIMPFYEGVYRKLITKITLENRNYFSFGLDNKLVIAFKSKLGSILGGDQQNIPANHLFFAGGGSSVRGYGYRSIGVNDERSNKIIGGRSLIETSLEFRMLPFRSWGFTSFVDAGLVGAHPIANKIDNSKVSLGIGTFYMSAVGPLRFDIAWPINNSRKSFSFYIAIGQTF